MNNVIYYLPIKKKYLNSWEYYNVDKSMLEKVYDNIIICNNFFSFLLNIYKVNHIYAWWWHRSLPVILISRLLNKKIFVTGAIHLNEVKKENVFVDKNKFYNFFLFLGLKFATKSLFISNHQYNEVKNYYKFKNIEILRSSLDYNTSIKFNQNILNKKSYINNNIKINKFSTIIWHVDSQYKRKGVFETLMAFEKLYNFDPLLNFEYVIAGKNGPDLNKLFSFVNKLKIKKFVFIKTDLTNDEKNELMFSSDFYIQPSNYEGFGNAVLEAMSNGSIPIVSNLTAQPEVVGNAGYLIDNITEDEIFITLKQAISIDIKKKISFLNLIEKHINDNFKFEIRCNNFKKILKSI